MLKKLAVIVFIVALVYIGLNRDGSRQHSSALLTGADSDQILTKAFAAQTSGFQVQGEGEVTRILTDDDDGGRHQRFIIRLRSAQTLLVAHNIDLASRVVGIKVGDIVLFNGEYEWNSQGGMIHWTHRDPGHHHPDGWIKHGGQIYQ